MGAKPPAHAVPHHCVPDAAPDCERHTDGFVVTVMGASKAEWAASSVPSGVSEEFELPSIPDRFDQALSLWRPLARRERMMARPARSDIRCRKPCFLERRRLLGWKVRFTVMRSPEEGPPRGQLTVPAMWGVKDPAEPGGQWHRRLDADTGMIGLGPRSGQLDSLRVEIDPLGKRG